MRIVRRETKRWVYLLGRGGGFLLLPRLDWRRGGNFGSLEWLWWMVDWVSKEHQDECARKGFGFGDVVGMLEEELRRSVPAGSSLESPSLIRSDPEPTKEPTK